MRSLIGLFLFVPAVWSQEPIDYAQVTRIRQEAFRKSQVMKTLRELTEGHGPRLTNSPAARKAAGWAVGRFQEWGLSAQLEEWGPFGRGWTLDFCEVHLAAPRSMPLLALPKAWSEGTKERIGGEACLVKLESPADFEKLKGTLAGKICFVSTHEPHVPSDKADFKRYEAEDLDDLCGYDMPETRSGSRMVQWLKRSGFADQRQAFLAEEGVLATVEVSSFKNGLIRVMGGSGYDPERGGGPVQLVMAVEHYNAICRYLENKETVRLELDVRVSFHAENPMSHNALAEIAGTGRSKKEIVMAGAHLDSWHAGTGTLDNAVGVAVVMEAARILKALGIQPNRTIRFGLWTGEEQGLLGSRAHVKQRFVEMNYPQHPAIERVPQRMRDYLASPVARKEHELFSVYFNMDNGGGKFRGIYAQENAAAVPIFKAWLAPFEDLDALSVTMNNTGSTDHISFDSAGLPGFQFIQDPLSYFSRNHHSNIDTLDHVVEEDLKQASAIMASCLYHASQRTERFPRKPMPQPENVSELLEQLAAPAGKPAAAEAPGKP